MVSQLNAALRSFHLMFGLLIGTCRCWAASGEKIIALIDSRRRLAELDGRQLDVSPPGTTRTPRRDRGCRESSDCKQPNDPRAHHPN